MLFLMEMIKTLLLLRDIEMRGTIVLLDKYEEEKTCFINSKNRNRGF